MARIGVDIEGVRELQRAVRHAKNAGLDSVMTEANRDAAELVVDIATPMTPRRHGDLQHSLKPQATRRTAKVKAGTPYAAAIHWGRKVGNVGSPPGNRKGPNPIKGRPFLWNAARDNQARIAAKYDKAMDHLANMIERVSL
jgi:hypothetical protein